MLYCAVNPETNLFLCSQTLSKTQRYSHIAITTGCPVVWIPRGQTQTTRTTARKRKTYRSQIDGGWFNTTMANNYRQLVWRMNEAKTMLVHETTSWYDKNGELTFADIIVAIRRSIWTKQHFSKSASNDDFVKFNAQEISHLINQLSLAAWTPDWVWLLA